jgi:pyruvate dehydrogenase E1 component alpha subunit
LRADDLITTTHRGHGDMIAKGPVERDREIYARAGSPGRADHVAVLGRRSARTGSSPRASRSVGAALGMKRQGRDAVVVCYSGDGAIVKGRARALNMASLWTLVIFVRVNNQYAESTPASTISASRTWSRFAAAYGLRAEQVDGNDVERSRCCRGAVARGAGRGRRSSRW